MLLLIHLTHYYAILLILATHSMTSDCGPNSVQNLDNTIARKQPNYQITLTHFCVTGATADTLSSLAPRHYLVFISVYLQ